VAGVAVAGPMSPEGETEELKREAERAGVVFRSFIPHLSALFGGVDCLVCMGGYNTIVEAVAQGVPSVCVPRVTPRTEQLLRAEAFERLDLLRVCRPDQLSPERLRDQIDSALTCSRRELRTRAHRLIGLDGAEQAARCLLAEAAPGTVTVGAEESLTQSVQA